MSILDEDCKICVELPTCYLLLISTSNLRLPDVVCWWLQRSSLMVQHEKSSCRLSEYEGFPATAPNNCLKTRIHHISSTPSYKIHNVDGVQRTTIRLETRHKWLSEKVINWSNDKTIVPKRISDTTRKFTRLNVFSTPKWRGELEKHNHFKSSFLLRTLPLSVSPDELSITL